MATRPRPPRPGGYLRGARAAASASLRYLPRLLAVGNGNRDPVFCFCHPRLLTRSYYHGERIGCGQGEREGTGGRLAGAPGARACANRRAWGPGCGATPGVWRWGGRAGRGAPGSSRTPGLHPYRCRSCGMALSDPSLPARGPFPHARLRGREHRASSPPSLPLRRQRAGAGRRRGQRTHARPLGSRRRRQCAPVRGGNRLCRVRVRAGALRVSSVQGVSPWTCGFGGGGAGDEPRPSHSKLPRYNLSLDLPFAFNEGNEEYGEGFLNCIPPCATRPQHGVPAVSS